MRLTDKLSNTRMRAEHPPNEADTVIARGRVLGGLEPSRVRFRPPSLALFVLTRTIVKAFGDARYKWPLVLQEKLAEAFHVCLFSRTHNSSR